MLFFAIDQRRNCHESIGLKNRYLMTIGATFTAWLMFKRRRMRKALYTFAFVSWFACPEWPSAYFMPTKKLIDMCEP